jgi:hypothetical protein
MLCCLSHLVLFSAARRKLEYQTVVGAKGTVDCQYSNPKEVLTESAYCYFLS